MTIGTNIPSSRMLIEALFDEHSFIACYFETATLESSIHAKSQELCD